MEGSLGGPIPGSVLITTSYFQYDIKFISCVNNSLVTRIERSVGTVLRRVLGQTHLVRQSNGETVTRTSTRLLGRVLPPRSVPPTPVATRYPAPVISVISSGTLPFKIGSTEWKWQYFLRRSLSQGALQLLTSLFIDETLEVIKAGMSIQCIVTRKRCVNGVQNKRFTP